MNDAFLQHAIVHRRSVKVQGGDGEQGTGLQKEGGGAIRAPTVRSGSRLPTVEFSLRAALEPPEAGRLWTLNFEP